MTRFTRALVSSGLTGAVVIAGFAACFSEREATAPAEGSCNFELGDDVAGSTLVVIRNLAFEPAELRVRVGERVTWVNCETNNESHTSTADAGAWSSPLLAPGQTFSRTFTQTGTFAYHCTPHPSMTAQVIVE
jgi:amicyanin